MTADDGLPASVEEHLLAQLREKHKEQRAASGAKLAHLHTLEAVLAERGGATTAAVLAWDKELVRLDDVQTRATSSLLGVLDAFLAERCSHGVRKDSVCRRCDPTVSIAAKEVR